jgi:hypothetical protein
MKYIRVIFTDHSEVIIEGFGTETIVGVVRDVLSGHYKPPRENVEVLRIEISDDAKMAGV